MSSAAELANSVRIKINKHGISILEKDPTLELIGHGRSAVVFKIKSTDRALKVLFPTHTHIAWEEAEVYRTLKGNPYFPNLYESGDNFLLIDYIEGNTLFDCLTNGIQLNESFIKETDNALDLASKAGLTPSDVHLRNIILTAEGKIKLIDVARFRQSNGCNQWEDLKKVFFMFYNKTYFPKKIPAFILNKIAYLYNLYNKKLIYLPE